MMSTANSMMIAELGKYVCTDGAADDDPLKDGDGKVDDKEGPDIQNGANNNATSGGGSSDVVRIRMSVDDKKNRQTSHRRKAPKDPRGHRKIISKESNDYCPGPSVHFVVHWSWGMAIHETQGQLFFADNNLFLSDYGVGHGVAVLCEERG
jgi:hypothetical protein